MLIVSKKRIGQYTYGPKNGADALSSQLGIGENAALVREDVISKYLLVWL